jgi:hypothetical protein
MSQAHDEDTNQTYWYKVLLKAFNAALCHLLLARYLSGIISNGPTVCGTEGIPAVYTKVASFLKWISENI